jgi:hypothetical protein
MNADHMFSQFRMDTKNKIIDSYLIVSQVCTDIIHHNLSLVIKKNMFDHFVTFFFDKWHIVRELLI